MDKKDKKQQRLLALAQEKEKSDFVRKALSQPNLLDPFPAFKIFNRGGLNVELHYASVSEVNEEHKKYLFDLTKIHMEEIYNKCHETAGWRDKQKYEELFNEDARFIIATDVETSKPVGFVDFRFEIDDGRAVLYIYELQVEEGAQRKGLGKFICQLLELIAIRLNLDAICLTCWVPRMLGPLQTQGAYRFFMERLKYRRDRLNKEFTLDEESNPNFVLLFKPMKRKETAPSG